MNIFKFKVLSRRGLTRIFSLAGLAVVLSSCYLPVRFDAEIELDRSGYYSLKFDGYMAEVGLYQGLKDGKISPAEEKKKMAVIERDFTRDASTQEYKYFRQGHFKLKWERSGDLIKARNVTFLRQSELILQLTYDEKRGYITLGGKSLTKTNRQRLRDIGLEMQGQIRIKTDLQIKTHNATRVKKDPQDKRFTWLAWDVNSIMSPRPNAVFIIE